MHRILITIGQTEISSYSFFMVLAFVISVGGFYFYARQRAYARQDLFVILPVLALSAFVGARLLHIFTNLGLYQAESWRVWLIDFSGFSIYGGILGALISGIIVARQRRLDIWRLGDTAAPILGLGIACMRIGCYLNGCCFGHATDLPWGVTFPYLSQAHSHQLSLDAARLFSVLPVHPTELYELGFALIASLLAYLIIRAQNISMLVNQKEEKKLFSKQKRNIPDGLAILVFGLIYTAGRLINLHFRVIPPTLDVPNWFYPGVYLGMILVIFGLIVWRIKKVISKL